MEEIGNLLVKKFRERFGRRPEARAWAPGRVNLIGEHTDYNDGYVLPIALDKRVYAAGAATGDDSVTLCSGNMRGEVAFSLNSIDSAGDWGDYTKGIAAKLIEKRLPIRGFNAYFLSNLPIGAGVSSSAAIEVAACYLLEKLFRFSLPPEEAAFICQKAEHEFAGTRCGIMDQFVSVLGSAGSALFLDCRSLEHRHVPLAFGDSMLVACDSRVERGLASSEYNRRRSECERSVEIVSKKFKGIRSLRDVTMAQLQESSAEMAEPVFRRCRHVVTENARVLAAIEMMHDGNVEGFGELMNLSHDSLRDDYEVSCPELENLVNSAREVKGVLGSRLTGAGFGGSTISLVHRNSVYAFQNHVSEKYLKEFGVAPRIFECVASDGAQRANGIGR